MTGCEYCNKSDCLTCENGYYLDSGSCTICYNAITYC